MADTTEVAATPAAPTSSHGAIEAPAESQAPAELEYDGTRESIGRMVEHSANEHETTKLLEGIAAKPDITLAELRTIPGAEKLDDTQLQALWDEVQGKPKVEAAKAPSAAAVKRAWKALQGDAEVTDFSKMSAEDLLKLTFEYNANGKPQRKAFDEIVRNAQQGHYNAERTQTLLQERNKAHTDYVQAQEQNQELTALKSVWTKAIAAGIKGDFEPLSAIMTEFQKNLDAEPETAAEPNGNMIPREEVEANQRGQVVYNDYVVPQAAALAQEYGVDQKMVADAIMYLVDLEPRPFFTPERLEQIVTVEIPRHIEAMLEAQGNTAPAAKPAAADPRDTKIAELTAALAASQTTVAATHNTRVEEVHRRRRNAPPAQTTIPVHGSGSDSPNFESADDARNWLKNLKV